MTCMRELNLLKVYYKNFTKDQIPSVSVVSHFQQRLVQVLTILLSRQTPHSVRTCNGERNQFSGKPSIPATHSSQQIIRHSKIIQNRYHSKYYSKIT